MITGASSREVRMSSLESMKDPGESPSQSNSAEKRPRGSPTLLTPRRKEKWTPLRELVAWASADDTTSTVSSLLPTTLAWCNDNDRPSKTKEKWSVCELKALTEFVLFHTWGKSWPSHKQDAFWRYASEFVKLKGGAVRSGKCFKLFSNNCCS